MLETEYGTGEQHDEADDGRVLEIGELQLARPELHPPADGRVGRGRLEAHGLPVGGLNVLEVVRLRRVVLVHLLAEEGHRVSGT